MRCSICERDKAAREFSKSQSKKAAGDRKCTTCAAAASGGAGNNEAAGLAQPNRSAEGGGATRAPTGGRAEPPAPSAVAATGTGGGAPPAVEADPPPALPLKVCSWVGCGKQLSADPDERLKCARCRRAYYCDRSCQKKHWKQGGHKHECEEPPCCTICLEGSDEPLPVQCGCACRGDMGLAHVACRAKLAAHKGVGWNQAWDECPTCGQWHTGGMQMGLARELVRRTERRAQGDHDRLLARGNLARALCEAGECVEAEALLQDVLSVRRRVYGRAHSATRAAGNSLANVLMYQGQHTEGMALLWEVLAATPAKEQETEITLTTKANLADSLSRMGEHSKAEELLCNANATEERLHGPDDARTLQTASMLGRALEVQGKHAEAEAVYRPTLAARRRVLGPDHPHTLRSMHNLAILLGEQGKHAEASQLFRSALEGRRRALGHEHALTLNSAAGLADTLRALGKHAETEALH